MSERPRPTVLTFDVDGLCDPEGGVCVWPAAQSAGSVAFQETED